MQIIAKHSRSNAKLSRKKNPKKLATFVNRRGALANKRQTFGLRIMIDQSLRLKKIA